MATKNLLPLLLVFALAGSSFAKSLGPADDSNNFIVENDDGEKISLAPKEYIVFYAVIGFRDMAQEYVDGAVKVSLQLLNDVDLRNSQSSTVRKFYKNITKFIEEYNEMDDLDELFNVFDLYSDSTSPYLEMEAAEATPHQLLIAEKLRKYDSDDLDEEFKKDFEEFDDKFLTQLQEFKSRLSTAELESYKGLKEWETKFRNTQDTQEKIDAFGEFFPFFEDED